MKKLTGMFLVLVLFTSCQQNVEKEEINTQDIETVITDGVFIHISHGKDDPHRVVMALQMANIMAEDKDVAVYFDIKGIEVVLNDAENIEYPTFQGTLEQLDKLKEKGILLMACPGCLKAAGKTAEDLMEGIIVAEKEKFFNFTKGRILSLDY